MKKKLAGLLAGVFLFSTALIGCSNNETSSSDKGDKGDKVKLTVWGDADNQATLETSFDKINKAFMEKYPNIELDYQYSGTLESINVALQSDTLPDLFWVQGNKSTKMAEMARNGYLLPLDEYKMDLSRFSEEAVEYGTVDGKLYSSLPSFIAYVTMYYNKDLFKKNKVDVPKTWEEFEKISKVLADKGVTPIAVGGNGDFDRYWMMQAMAASLGNETLTSIVKGEENVNYTGLEKTFEAYSDFAKKGYFGKDVASIDGNGAKLAFTNGKAAMIPDGTWNNLTYQDTPLNIGSFALPGLDGKTYAQTGPYNGNTYAISSKTKHPDEAVKYLEFLNSKEAQQIMGDETGLVPMYDDIKPKDKFVEEMAKFDVVGLNIYNALAQVANESSKPQDLLLTNLTPKLMTGDMTAKEAIVLMKAELAKKAK
ncbi:sugar ABC transporter substrate-binding protein [Neobacillus sp. OS1-2]|uniref:ABC transporter substrate-binding protein n=1 Tax=Neobacillus sp. OS1-2 TaxID=3070680 RepID=UPI0027E03E6B|nr:sugar ABC transporter substrate-binding protein [Neobacillus sp. OS1-2]WML41487.1 sugar ABC transporter substrate-binding protein [Neobacillus sp. OS1-2]